MSEKKYGKRPSKKDNKVPAPPTAAEKAKTEEAAQAKAAKAAKGRESGQKRAPPTKPRGTAESVPVTQPSTSTAGPSKKTSMQQPRRNAPTNKKGSKGDSAST